MRFFGGKVFDSPALLGGAPEFARNSSHLHQVPFVLLSVSSGLHFGWFELMTRCMLRRMYRIEMQRDERIALSFLALFSNRNIIFIQPSMIIQQLVNPYIVF